jgi:GntR family transcriptional regulator/MocR family aminotransferase
MIDAIAHRVSLTDGMGNALTEDAAAELIENGELRRHARKVWQVYAERRESFAAELDTALGDIVRYKMPDGGLAFWLQFPGIDLDQMETRASAMGLRFASSRSFMTRDDAPRGLRIGFASLNSYEARTALAAIRKAAAG